MCVCGGGEERLETRLDSTPGPSPAFFTCSEWTKRYGDKVRHKALAFIHVEGSGHKINPQFVFLSVASQLASAGLSVTNLGSDNNFSSFIHNLV